MLKIINIKFLLISILAVFAPIKATLVAITTLVLLDLITGLVSAIKQKLPITSAGLSRTIVKFGVYYIAILAGFLTEQYLMSGLLPVMKIVAGMIGATELKSILENLDGINGSPLFNTIIQKLASQNAQQTQQLTQTVKQEISNLDKKE